MSQYIVNPFYTFGNPPTETENSWLEIGRTILVAPSDTIDVSVPKKRFLMILVFLDNSGSITPRLRVGTTTIDVGANYTNRFSANGGGDSPSVSDTSMIAGETGSYPRFVIFWIDNNPSGEKFAHIRSVSRDVAGAGTAPSRVEIVSKWQSQSDQIDQIQLLNTGTGDFDTGSEVVVLGWDPQDQQSPINDFWQLLNQTTLTIAGDVLDTGVFPAKKYLWVEVDLVNFVDGTSIDGRMTFNSDVGVSYARRGSQNGGADLTFVSLNNIIMSNALVGKQRFVFYIHNVTTKEKLSIQSLMENVVAGAGTMGNRGEQVAKWINIVAQITRITMTNFTANDYGAGSTIKVWGHD